MKLALALCATLGLVLAPAAYAQVSCSEFARITSEGLGDFSAITGDEVQDDLYESSVWLSGADDCGIGMEWDSIYTCLYQFDSYASASASLSTHLAELSSCLAGWAPSSIAADDIADDGFRTLSGTRYSGTGDYEDMDWAVILQEHTGEHGTDYHVLVELVYWL